MRLLRGRSVVKLSIEAKKKLRSDTLEQRGSWNRLQDEISWWFSCCGVVMTPIVRYETFWKQRVNMKSKAFADTGSIIYPMYNVKFPESWTKQEMGQHVSYRLTRWDKDVPDDIPISKTELKWVVELGVTDSCDCPCCGIIMVPGRIEKKESIWKKIKAVVGTSRICR